MCILMPEIIALVVQSDVRSSTGSGHLRPPSAVYKYVVADSGAIIQDFSDLPSSSLHEKQVNRSHSGFFSATGSFPEDALHAHNVVRKRGGVPPLEWSSDLAQMASAAALQSANEGCYIKHSPVSDRWDKGGFEYVGENLYKVINMKPSGVDVVDAWYAESDDYTYGLVGSPCVKDRCHGRTSSPCMLGHFTQIMWAETTHVGCARAMCPDQAKPTFISVCNYGPGGNIVGKYPFPASNSGTMGFGTQDCRKRSRQATGLHSSAHRQVSTSLLVAALALASAACLRA